MMRLPGRLLRRLFGHRPGPGQAHDLGELYLGLLDALLTIAVTCANKGLVERGELARAFGETARQQAEQGASDSRRLAVRHLGQFFELGVELADRGDRGGLRVIAGGKAEPPPAA